MLNVVEEKDEDTHEQFKAEAILWIPEEIEPDLQDAHSKYAAWG